MAKEKAKARAAKVVSVKLCQEDYGITSTPSASE